MQKFQLFPETKNLIRKKISVLTYSLICSLIFSSAQALEIKAENQKNDLYFQLKNGLKVILIEDHRSPVATQMIWYKVGSGDETLGKTGIAHVLEHMMFKGTKHLKKGEFSKIVGSIGGKENAFTSNDYTAYFEQFPAKHLEKMLGLELERLQHLIVDEKEFKKEIEVVKEERRMRTDDQPRSLAYEQLLALAYTTSSYHHPVIGWMQDLNELTALDAQKWHEKWYQPQQGTLILMGDFDRFSVQKMIEKTWGNIGHQKLGYKNTYLQTAKWIEKPLSGMKKAVLTEEVANPYWIMGFHGVNQLNPKKAWVLKLLSVILDGYEGAILSEELIQKQKIATHVGVGFDAVSRHENPLFLVEGIPNISNDDSKDNKDNKDNQNINDKNVAADNLEKAMLKLEQAWWKVITNIQKNGVSEEQLQRAKNQLTTQRIYGLDSQFNQVLEIGQLDNAGIDYSQQQKWHDSIQDVNILDIQKVAQELLQPQKSVQIQLFPKK